MYSGYKILSPTRRDLPSILNEVGGRGPEGADAAKAAEVHGLAVRLQVADVAQSSQFYQQVLACTEVSPGVLRCGEALLVLEQASARCAPTVP